MMTHELKCLPRYFLAIRVGAKTFEVRRGEDRQYDVGDRILLREYDLQMGYSGEVLLLEITYVMHGGALIPEDCWILSVRILKTRTEDGPDPLENAIG